MAGTVIYYPITSDTAEIASYVPFIPPPENGKSVTFDENVIIGGNTYIVNSIGTGAIANNLLETITISGEITNFGYRAFYNGTVSYEILESLTFDGPVGTTGPVPTGIIFDNTKNSYIDNNEIFVNSLNTITVSPATTPATIQVPGPKPTDTTSAPLYSTSIVEAIQNDYLNPKVDFKVVYVLQTASNNVQYVSS